MKKKIKKKLFNPKTRLYWIKKKGDVYLIGANEFDIYDMGYTELEAKEMFLEKMIIMYGDLLERIRIEADRLSMIHEDYAHFTGLEELNRETMTDEEFKKKMKKTGNRGAV